MAKICSVNGCERKHRTLGYCEFHWKKSDLYKKSKKKSEQRPKNRHRDLVNGWNDLRKEHFIN